MSTMYFRVLDPTPERHAAMLLAITPSNGTLVGDEIEPALDLKLRELFCIREPAMLSLIETGGSFLLAKRAA